MSYWLGVATPFIAYLLFCLVFWAVDMSQRSSYAANGCDLCEEAGYRLLAPTEYPARSHSNWRASWDLWLHLHVTARLPRHRDAWQRYWYRHPNMRPGNYETIRLRYGRPDSKAL